MPWSHSSSGVRGRSPALPCPCHCLRAGRSRAGLQGAALYNWLQNTKHVTFPERPLLCCLRQAPLAGTGEEECEMSKAQTPARSAPDARLCGDVAAHGSAGPASLAQAAGTVGSGGGLESAGAQGKGRGELGRRRWAFVGRQWHQQRPCWGWSPPILPGRRGDL